MDPAGDLEDDGTTPAAVPSVRAAARLVRFGMERGGAVPTSARLHGDRALVGEHPR